MSIGTSKVISCPPVKSENKDTTAIISKVSGVSGCNVTAIISKVSDLRFTIIVFEFHLGVCPFLGNFYLWRLISENKM